MNYGDCVPMNNSLNNLFMIFTHSTPEVMAALQVSITNSKKSLSECVL